MVKDEEYISFLKSIISCVNHGDYYSVKELSHLELERMKQRKSCFLKYSKNIAKKPNKRYTNNEKLEVETAKNNRHGRNEK